MSELVSVIIPTYKGHQYVGKAIKSVQNQTYSNIEIIVVDDNGVGTDEQKRTQSVVEEFFKDKRIRYITHEVNKNGSAARNTGFRNSRGEYIALLDDDDEYLPNKIEMEVNELSALDASWGMVYCSSDKNAYTKKKSGKLLYELLLHTVVIGSNSFLVRREIWDKVKGFDESFRRHQDFEFTARVAATCKIKGLNQCGFIYNSDVGRNKAKNIAQLQEHRTHYINKMLPLIRTFDVKTQKVIICSNAMQVTSQYLIQGQPIKFFHELKTYSSQWEPNFGLFTILQVSVMKVNDRIYKKVKKLRSISECRINR